MGLRLGYIYDYKECDIRKWSKTYIIYEWYDMVGKVLHRKLKIFPSP